MKNKIKRIIALVLCVLLAASFTVFADDSDGIIREKGYEETDIPAPRYGGSKNVYAGYTPNYIEKYDSYQYTIFEEILKEYVNTHLYEFTEEQVLDAFVRKLFKDNPELAKMYIDTMLGTMDEYSAYYEFGTGLADDGSTLGYGIGITDETSYIIRGMGLEKAGVYVSEVYTDSPAQKSGISAGDRIISVQGIPVSGLTVDGALYLIKRLPYVEKELFDENGVSLGIPNEPEYILDEQTGAKKYPLCLVLERPGGEQYTVKLLKDRMLPSSIAVDIPQNKTYAYIQIASFRGESLVEDFKKALDTARKAKRDDLIIDLRDNGGGFLDYAVDMANLLIAEEGRVLYYTNSRNKDTLAVTKSVGGGEPFGRITVMLNGYSASASELFAMILRFNCGATIVGSNSYGKGVGQTSYGFMTGDVFTITSFEILDPLKNSYNKTGLVPDVACAPAMKKFDFPNDLEVFNYINYKELSQGVVSDTVKGLERRLALMGFLRYEYVDDVYDEHTTAAIKTFKRYYNKPLSETLDDEDVDIITKVINGYKNYYYYYDAEMEVAEMTFSSRSQAKRRAKEIERAHNEVVRQKQEYDDAIMAEIIAQEKAEREALKTEETKN